MAAAAAGTRLRDVSARGAGRERRRAAARRACAPSAGGTDVALGSRYRAEGVERAREVTWALRRPRHPTSIPQRGSPGVSSEVVGMHLLGFLRFVWQRLSPGAPCFGLLEGAAGPAP